MKLDWGQTACRRSCRQETGRQVRVSCYSFTAPKGCMQASLQAGRCNSLHAPTQRAPALCPWDTVSGSYSVERSVRRAEASCPWLLWGLDRQGPAAPHSVPGTDM